MLSSAISHLSGRSHKDGVHNEGDRSRIYNSLKVFGEDRPDFNENEHYNEIARRFQNKMLPVIHYDYQHKEQLPKLSMAETNTAMSNLMRSGMSASNLKILNHINNSIHSCSCKKELINNKIIKKCYCK